jgi:hypothetical protein
VQVDIHGHVPRGFIGVFEESSYCYTSVCEEQVDKPKLFPGCIDKRNVACFGADVCNYGKCGVGSKCIQLGFNLLQVLGVAVCNDNASARSMKASRERSANSVCGTSNNGGGSLKIHVSDLMASVTRVIHPVQEGVHFLVCPICTMREAGGPSTSGSIPALREELHMLDTRESVITEAIAVIDKALAEMLRRELVSAVEVGDLLLDLRTLLSASAATTDA